ncbi:MAG: undecaprenyldiphospho-muramoylpentapeptide beta-N-acetylglucosaminyltransferase [Sphingomonadales bacterium]
MNDATVLGNEGHFVIAAGGTGGHMAPAYAVAQLMLDRGYTVTLITDERGQAFPGKPERVVTSVLDAQVPRTGVFSLLSTAAGVRKAQRQATQFLSVAPVAAVIGFGGYPALPTLLAAKAMNIPYMTHEQNAVLGRTNRLTGPRAAAVAISFPGTQKLPAKWHSKTALTGTPVRPDILEKREEEYPILSRDSLMRILILGGSQGARILSDVVPEAVSIVPPALRQRLQITQHCRQEDLERVRGAYAELKVAAEVTSFIQDVGEKLRWTHLVIARAGASTIAELTAVGRPSILVPFAAAMDDHQRVNAEMLSSNGAAITMTEEMFDARSLAKQLQKLSLAPGTMAEMAEAAKRLGYPRATKHLADMCEFVGRGGRRDAA